MDNNMIGNEENPLENLWANMEGGEYREDDILANIIEDEDDYEDEYFDPDEFE